MMINWKLEFYPVEIEFRSKDENQVQTQPT